MKGLYDSMMEQIGPAGSHASVAIGLDSFMRTRRIEDPLYRVYVDGVGSIYEVELQRSERGVRSRLADLPGAAGGTMRIYYEPEKFLVGRTRMEREGGKPWQVEVNEERLDAPFDFINLRDALAALGLRSPDRIEDTFRVEEFWAKVKGLDWQPGGVVERYFVFEATKNGENERNGLAVEEATSRTDANRLAQIHSRIWEAKGYERTEEGPIEAPIDNDLVAMVTSISVSIPELVQWSARDLYHLTKVIQETKLRSMVSARPFGSFVRCVSMRLAEGKSDRVDTSLGSGSLQVLVKAGLLRTSDDQVNYTEKGRILADFIEKRGVRIYNRT
jgi:hypothetical protein